MTRDDAVAKLQQIRGIRFNSRVEPNTETIVSSRRGAGA